jgi:hypothetical protein
MARQNQTSLLVMVNASIKDFSSKMQNVSRTLTKTSKQMKSLGSSMSMSITAPLGLFSAAAIKSASDFDEANSKFNTIFRDISKSANETAQDLANSFGLSSGEALELLGNTGDLLTGFGFTQEEALGLSEQVNKLAVDLASFTNFSGGASGSSEALTKALLGEREAIKSLGIAITEADLKKFAEEQGLVFKELDRVAKAQLTFDLALRQSQNAVGDFERTQGSFANQTRILKADISDLAVSFGQMLLPIAMKIVQIAKDLVNGFLGLSKETKQTIVIIGGLVASIGPLVYIGGVLIGVLSSLLSPIGLVALAIAGIGVVATHVINNWEALKERFSDLGWWKNMLISMVAFFNEFANPFSLIIKAYNKMVSIVGGEGITNPFETAADKLKDLKVETKDYENEVTSLGDSLVNLKNQFAGAFGGGLGSPSGIGGGGTTTGGEAQQPMNLQTTPLAEQGGTLLPPPETLTATTEQLAMQEDAVNSLQGSYTELQQTMVDAGKNIGLSLSKGAESFKEFGEAAKSSGREFMDVVWAKISAMAIEKALASVPPTPFNLVLIPAAIGMALGLVKTAFNQITPFAEGGIVTGPTMGLVGEAGPEVIFPLSKLKSFIGGEMGGKVQVQGILTGQDIFLSNARTDISLNRIAG